MTTKLMKITDEKSWLEKRKGYITSTQISALFGMNTYQTAFELYHTTRGNIEPAFVDNKFAQFGRIIEQPICEMINIEHPDWKIDHFPYFAYDDEDKIGSSFDRIIRIDGKIYLLELKSISYAQYKKKFIEHSKDDIEASPQYEIQMHTQMEMTQTQGEIDGIVMAVFILDTRELRYIFRTYDPEMGAELRAAAREFWAMKEQPEPDYARDKSIISQICPFVNPDLQMNATENNEIKELVAQYTASKELEKQEKGHASKASAELMILAGDARYIWTNDHKISISDVKETSTKVTQDMVGTIINQRKGFKKLIIRQIKKD